MPWPYQPTTVTLLCPPSAPRGGGWVLGLGWWVTLRKGSFQLPVLDMMAKHSKTYSIFPVDEFPDSLDLKPGIGSGHTMHESVENARGLSVSVGDFLSGRATCTSLKFLGSLFCLSVFSPWYKFRCLTVNATKIYGKNRSSQFLIRENITPGLFPPLLSGCLFLFVQSDILAMASKPSPAATWKLREPGRTSSHWETELVAELEEHLASDWNNF